MNKTTISIAVALVILAGAGFLTLGQSNPQIEWYWTHPITGGEVEFYRAEYQIITDAGNFISLIDSIPPGNTEHGWLLTDYQVGATVSLRVAGVDAQNRQGLWSPWSEPWIDDGPPGTPGKPSRTLAQ